MQPFYSVLVEAGTARGWMGVEGEVKKCVLCICPEQRFALNCSRRHFDFFPLAIRRLADDSHEMSHIFSKNYSFKNSLSSTSILLGTF